MEVSRGWAVWEPWIFLFPGGLGHSPWGQEWPWALAPRCPQGWAQPQGQVLALRSWASPRGPRGTLRGQHPWERAPPRALALRCSSRGARQCRPGSISMGGTEDAGT